MRTLTVESMYSDRDSIRESNFHSDTIRPRGERRWVSVLSVLAFCSVAVLLSACQKESPTPSNAGQMAAQPAYLDHTVRYQGETLGTIAKWYTGNERNWKQIAAANPGLKPNRIQLGQTIRIPYSLVVERTPLPQAKVRRLATETRAVAKQIDEGEVSSGKEPAAPAATTQSVDDELRELEALDANREESAAPSAATEGSESLGGAVTSGADATSSEGASGAISSESAAPADVSGAAASPSATASGADSGATPPSDGASAGAPTGGAGDDAERERLLDELLEQQ